MENQILSMLNKLTPHHFKKLSKVFNHYKSKTKIDFEIIIKVGEVKLIIPYHNLGVSLTEKILKDEGFYKNIFNEIWDYPEVIFIGLVTKEGDRIVLNLENKFTKLFDWYDEEFVWILDYHFN